MTTEIAVLALAGLLAGAQLVLLSVVANLTMSSRWLVGPRDEPREVPRLAGRLKRAFDNHVEGLVMFTVAAVAVELSGAGSGVTATAAAVYLAARVLYVPAYAFGIPWVRSLIWAAGFLATMTMLAAALLD